MNAEEHRLATEQIYRIVARRTRYFPWPRMRAKDKSLFQYIMALVVLDICLCLIPSPVKPKEIYDNDYWKN